MKNREQTDNKTKMADLSSNIIITLNINGLSTPIKRFAEWIKKHNPTIWCLPETPNISIQASWKVKAWEKIYAANIK